MAISAAGFMTQANFFAEVSVDVDLSPEDQEAFRRSTAHSAYYGCYHHALEWAKARGYKRPHDWSSHEALWDCWFAQEPECDDIRQAGKSLMAKRVSADYRVKEAFNHVAEDIIDEADEFFELIKKDIDRVSAFPKNRRKVNWVPANHPNPRRKSN